MTKTSRLCTIALAIGLSTPAAAVTVTLTNPFNVPTRFLIVGPDDGPSFWIYGSGSLFPEPPVLAPANGDQTKVGYWEYWVDAWRIRDGVSYPSGIVASACYWNVATSCHPEKELGPYSFHASDIVRFDYIFVAGGVFSDLPRPELRLDLYLPEGVTLSHMPLPASWVLLASMLGLGGLFRWAKHRVVAP